MSSKAPHIQFTGPPKNRDTVTLGITGHRKLNFQNSIAQSIQTVFSSLFDTQITKNPTTAKITLLSPIAEGADRLAAKEILNFPHHTLHVILPLLQADYENDFLTTESQTEFKNLLVLADSIKTLPPQTTRGESYLAVGCHIVDNCDILLAVWDGLPARGKGGTAEIVAYARKCEKPVIVIDSENPTRIVYERLLIT